MSGFEVVGVALGAFPVAVHGLERAVQGMQALKRWRRYRSKLDDYSHVVETLHTYYLDTLAYLLTDIADDCDLDDFLYDTSSDKWRRPEYELRLGQRLGRSFKLYMQKSSAMTSALSDFCRELGVDSSGKVSEYSSAIGHEQGS